MASNSTTFRTTTGRAFRRILPWALALAVATCTDDQNGPSAGGTGYFSFRPVYGISSSLSQFGIVADSVHITLTRPVDQLVLDTTVFFPPDSTGLRLALPIHLEQSPETLAAVIEIKAGGTILFVDSVDVKVVDGPPSPADIPTVVLDYVGPGKNVAAITLDPADTTIVLGDTLFFSATAIDSSDAPVASFFVAWKTSDTNVAKINAAGRLIAPNLRGSVRVIGYTPTGIADTTLVTFAPVPVIVTADSGNAQSGLAGDSLAAQFVARVKGADSLGISGVAVRFAAVTAGGAVRDTVTLITDAQGRVRTRALLGTTAGAYSYTATVVGTALTRTFTATATAGAASAIAIFGGNAQTDSAGVLLPTLLTVRVTDAFNNRVAGAKVYWTRPVGTGTRSADSTVTDALGLASISYTLGAVGLDSVRATLAGTSAFVDFSETAINGLPATVAKTFGDAQSDTVGRLLTDSLVVIVRSATAQPVTGQAVVWTVLRGGATSTDTVLTDVNGRAAVAYTLGTTPGTDSVRAQAGAASAVFTETAITGLATTLSLVSGDAQTDTAGNALPLPFVVHAVDAFGNSVSGTDILFTRTAGSGTLADDTVATDGAGNASVGYTLGAPGTDTVTAQLLCGCSTVTFTATALSSAPASIVVVQGDSQTVVVNTVADTFAALVKDGANNPVAGVKVNWSFIPAQGSFTEILPAGIQQSFTDSLGVARGIYTAGTQAGTILVEVQVGALIDSIHVFAVPAAPSTIAIQSGDAQSDTVGNAIPLPFVARVRDPFGNPVAGAMVLFTRIAGSGTLFADSVATNASGDAIVGYLFGLVPGVDTIRATLSGSAAFVDFEATAIASPPTSIVNRSGGGQSAAVTAPLTDSLEVEVLNVDDNPVVNGKVVWTAPAGGLSLSADTTTTNLLGRTFIHVAAGTLAGNFVVYARPLGLADSAAFAVNVVAGPANAIAIVSGDGQSDTTGRTLALPFVVQVNDAFGNPVAGTDVQYQVFAGSGNVDVNVVQTDALGQASGVYTLGAAPGTDTVRVTLVSTSAFVDFTVNALSGAPAGIIKLLGDNQADTVLSTLTDSLVVQLLDAGATPIPNAWLYWTTAGMTLSADSTKTDVNGKAAVQVTFGSIAVPALVVVHNVDTTLATVFTLRMKAGRATTATAVSGLGQTAAADATLPIDFGVFLQDAYGNHADSGVAVTWTNIAGFAAAGLPDTTVTDSLGLAYLTAPHLGPIAREDSLQAQILGGADTALFTATATAGAAGSLVYVSGTGQTDTVAATLASPFVVQVRDAGSNPVPGVWVRWTDLTGGNGILDSVQTDGTGVASTPVTLGSVAQLDSVIATIGSLTDTVAFYAVATPGTPTTIVPFSGDAQSGAVGGTLPSSLVAKLTDGFGNAINGATIEFLVAGGSGLTFANSTPLTDANGLASPGTVTLDGPAGTYTTSATLTTDPSVTMDFTTVILPIGTSKQWNGLSSNNWADPSNWSPAGLPSSSDNVFIPVGAVNQPVLDVSRTIGGLNVESGADVNVQGNILTLNGSLIADGTISRTSGHTILAGTGVTAHGTIGAIQSTGSVTLDGRTTVESNLQITAGTFDVGGQTLTLNGDLDVSGGGALRMTAALDSVEVIGNAGFSGSTGTGNLTAGVLTIRGDFTESSGSATFRASGTHKTVFAGGSAQNVSFLSPGLGSDQFQDVEFRSPVSVSLLSDIAAAGTVSVPQGSVFGGGRTAVLGGDLVDAGTPNWFVNTTTFAGSPSILPDTLTADVGVTGSVTLPASLVVQGSLDVASGTLTINGHRLQVDGGLSTTGSGQLRMQDVQDSVEVGGGATFNGSTATGLLTAGDLVLHGDLTELSGSSTFRAGGTHTVTFVGPGAQTVYFNAPGLGGDQFQNVTFASVGGVVMASDLAAAGTGTITAGTLTGPGFAATIGADLVDASGVSWNPDLTILTGNPAVLPDSLSKDLEVAGTVSLPTPLVVKGNFTAGNGSFSVNGQTLRIDGNLNVAGSAQFKMNFVTDSVDVGGVTTWNGSTSTGLLTGGHLVLRGNFSELSGASTFRASGTHTTVFAGSGAQSLAFNLPGLGGDQFQNVEFANTAGTVDATTSFAAAGDATVTTGAVTGTGIAATIGADLIDASGTGWQTDTLILAGSPAQLPAAFPRTLGITGTVTLPNDVVVHGNLFANNGSLDLNGHTLTADSDLTVSGSAQIKMQNAADVLDIGGATFWNGSTATGLLTAGSAIFRGDFSETSGSSTYRASGTHTTVFAGSAPQTVSFNAPGLGGDQFWDVSFNNTAGVTVTSDFAVGGQVNVANGLVTSPGTATVDGSVSGFSGFDWHVELTRFNSTPAAVPDSFSRSVEFTQSFAMAQPFKVGGALLVSGGTFDPSGWRLRVDSVLTISGSAQFLMQGATDSVDVGGTATFNGSTNTGLLMSGVLVLHGDLSAPAGVPTFQPGGTHVTRFTSGIHAVDFPSNSDFAGNRFQTLEVTNASNVNTATDLYVAGTFRNIAGPTGNLIGSGPQRLVTNGLAVNNWNFDGIRVEYHGPASFQLDNVNFVNQDPTLVQLDIRTDGGSAVTLTTASFTTTPTTGKYIAATDTSSDGQPVVIAMAHSFPLDGSAFEQEVGGNDGVTIDWSRLVFADQPTDIIAGGTLAPVRVALLNPAGDTATFFTDNVTLAIGTNPASGTLGGTTTQAAVNGVATFSDLTIDNAGTGYTLDASVAGFPTLGSTAFGVTVPLPVGFDAQWTGATSSSWFDPTNWSTGTVPDSTVNVFISGVAPNAPQIPADSGFVKRLRLAPGATLDITGGTKLYADSSVEAATGMPGAGTLVMRGTGDISGNLGNAAWITGTYGVIGTAEAFDLEIMGDLTVDNDTVNVGFLLQTQQFGKLNMIDPDALVYVAALAAFNPNGSGSGNMSDGTLRLGGNISSYGGGPDGFQPSGNQVTEFVGAGTMNADFYTPDPVTGSHFNHVRVNGTGTVNLQDHFDILGNLDVVQGTLSGDPGMGVTVHGATTVANGAFLALHDVIAGGPITTAVGSSYAVPMTTYFGSSPFAINAIPYDTLEIDGRVAVAEDFLVTGDLRIVSSEAPVEFDLTSHHVTVSGDLNITGSNSILTMKDPAGLLDVAGDFNAAGASTTGTLTNGTIRLSGDLTAGGSWPDAYAPSGNHMTVFNGSGVQTVDFSAPDSGIGSHFARLQVSTAGTAFMLRRYDAMGDVTITAGSRLADSMGAGFVSHGYTNLDPGATLDVNTLFLKGGLATAGATYTVPTTVYFGNGVNLINAAPYDTLVIADSISSGGDIFVAGELRVEQMGAQPALFDVSSNHVTVAGAVNIINGGGLVMTNPSGFLEVGGDFFTNGTSTIGMLKAGLLQIAGNFRQAGDGSGAAFWAEPGHVTRFTGGTGIHNLQFDNGAGAANDSANSRFGQLELIGGTDSIIDRVAASGKIIVAADVQSDTAQLANTLAAFDSLVLNPASTQFLVRNLESWNGVDNEAGFAYHVLNTTFYGGSGFPVLPYANVTVSGTSMTGMGDITTTGSFTVGISFEVGGTTGSVAMGGHTFTVGGPFAVRGFGDFSMGAGDSLDVSGAITFRGRKIEGNLTGGTLVARNTFEAQGDSVFIADPAHRTVFAAPGTSTLYVSTGFAEDLQFGKLYVLDGGVRTVSGFGTPFTVRDSLVLGSASSGLDGTGDNLVAQGPIFGVTGSTLDFNQIEVFNTLVTSGGYNVTNTAFYNDDLTIPVLPYVSAQVYGRRTLEGDLVLGTGSSVGVSNTGAELILGGNTLVADVVSAQSLGVITMNSSADTVEVRSSLSMSGGNESGHLTDGVMRVRGALYQGNTYNDSTLVSTINHRFEFIDSTTAVTIFLSSMDDGRSRFNDVSFYGQGANFSGDAWISGAITMPDPISDSVTGIKARITGTLTDPNYLWQVDTTVVRAASASLPDSITKHLTFETDYALTNLLRVGGLVQVHDTVFINGYTLLAHYALDVEGAGLLQMTSPTADVQVDGVAVFNGAPTGSLMSAGRLTLRSSLLVPGTGSFDATGTHTTVLAGGGLQTINFTGGAQGYGFNDLEIRTTDLDFSFGGLAHGSINDSIGAAINISGNDSALVGRQVHLLDATLNDTRLVTGDSLLLGNITFNFSDPEAKTQLTIRGAGQSVPVDLNGIFFNNVPTAGQLLAVIDTAGGPDPLNVRIFGSVPFDGSTYTTVSGNASATWSHLALSTPLPATIDSIIPFGLTLNVIQPDGSPRFSVNGSVDVSLLNGGTATLSGGTTASFDGPSANFFGLVLDGAATGASLHFVVQGQPMDTLTAGPFDIINPAPVGAAIFTGVVSTDWNDPGNWSPNGIPSPAADIFIPGNTSVQIAPANTFVVNTLVLGSGAHLDLGFGSTLTVNGNAYAGNTIGGTGSVVIAGGASQISGTFPSMTVTGQASAVGRTSIAGDLIVTGPGADFNVGGQFVDVSNTLFTQSGGVFTMDGTADTLYVSTLSLSGGDETGRLIDGILLVQGNGFDEAGGDPNAFHASGNHTTIFGSSGSSTAVNIGDPYASQFAHVKVQNPDGVDFNESGLDFVRITGDLTLSAGGAASGDTIKVDGTFTTDGSTNITANTLIVGETPVLAGAYNVYTTWFTGSPSIIPAAPVVYERLYIDNAAALGSDVTARTVLVTGAGQVDVNGYNFLIDSLYTTASGTLLMDAAEDTVLVADTAAFFGGDETVLLTDGVLRLGGSFNATGDHFTSTGNHLTEFFNPIPKVMKISPDGYCEGSCPFSQRIQFAHLKVEGTTLTIDDPVEAGLFAGDVTVVASNVSGVQVDLQVGGDLHADAPSTLTLRRLITPGALDIQIPDGSFSIGTVQFAGNGQSVPDLNYNQILVTGALVTLADTIDANLVVVAGNGVLAMGGWPLTTSGNFLNTGASHLLMQNPLDTLTVNGTAIFSADSTLGDFTAGAIKTGDFFQQHGTTGRGFQETGSHRVVLETDALFRMQDPGSAGSYLKTIDFSSGNGTVDVEGLWVTDTVILNDPGTTVFAAPAMQFSTGTLVFVDGILDVDRMGLGAELSYTGGTYSVDTTVFAGAGQVIPTNVPYNDIEVFYSAQLAGDLSLPDRHFTVMNTGSLDLAGHTLTMTGLGSGALFETQGYGVLVMDDPADALTVTNAKFGGGDETGLLTAGTLQVGNFQQVNGIGTINTFVASGTHLTEFINIGFSPESGYDLQMDPDAADTASHFNDVSFLGTSGVNLSTNVYAAGAVNINNTLDGGVYTITAAGAITIGNAAAVTLDTLRVLSTLSVDPSATLDINNTVFGPAAAPMPVLAQGYDNVVIEGAQTLTGDFDVPNLLTVRGGVLTPAGSNLTAGGLALQEDAHLVMANPADTVEVGTASFDGAASGADLAAGVLRLRSGLQQAGTTSLQSFTPTGMMVEFYGGGTATISFGSPGTGSSYLGDVRIIENTTVTPLGNIAVTGALDVTSGSTFDATPTFNIPIDLFGTVTVAPGANFVNTAFGSVNFYSVPVIDPSGYNVSVTSFSNVSSIPALPYQSLYLVDGTNITLSADLTVSSFLQLGSINPGGQNLTLNGHKVTANGFSTDGFGRLTMTDPADTLEIAGYASFNGGSTEGRLTAGLIRVGQGVLQDGTNSPSSFRSTGTMVEFTNPSLQASIQLGTPDSSQFAGIRSTNFNQLWLRFNTNAIINGPMTGYSMNLEANPSTLIIVDTLAAGPSGASVTLPAIRTKAILGSMGTYDVDRTEFIGNGVLPSLFFDTLVVAGNDSITTGSVFAVRVDITGDLDVATGGSLHAFKLVSVGGVSGQLRMSGGNVLADSAFATVAGGTLRANSGSVTARDVSFGGGATTGLLTGGGMNVTGNFEQIGVGTFSFDADSTFTVAINGGGQHAISIADPATSTFGTLLLEGSSPGTDTTTFPVGTITAYRLSTNNSPVIIQSAGGSELQVATLDVHTLADSGVRIRATSVSDQPLSFDDVTFRGFGPVDIQLWIDHPGVTGDPGPDFIFTNVDFDDIAVGLGGLFINLNNNGLATPQLNLQILGPDSGNGPATSTTFNSTIDWQPPS